MTWINLLQVIFLGAGHDLHNTDGILFHPAPDQLHDYEFRWDNSQRFGTCLQTLSRDNGCLSAGHNG